MQTMQLPELPSWLPCWNSANVDLESQLSELSEKAHEIQGAADTEGRALTPEEATEIQALYSQFQMIEARITAHDEAQKALSLMTPRSMGRKTSPNDTGNGGHTSDLLRRSDGAVDPAQLRLLQRQPFKGRDYISMFGKPQERNPFPSIDEYLDIIANNRFDPRLVRASAMSEGVDSEGGYAVPPDFAFRWLDSALEQSILWGRVRVEPMVSKTKEVGTFDNFQTTGGSPFGLSLQWKAEDGSWNEQAAKTRSILLTAKVAGIYVPFSNELGDDGGQSFAQLLQSAVIGAVSYGIDDAMISGNGAGKPLGILHSSSLILVAKETGQLADTIEWENVTKMYIRLHPACVANAVWLANPSCLPQLLTLSIPTGANMQFYPVLREESGAYYLLGRPLFLTEKCPTLGDQGDLILLDPSQIILGLRRDMSIALSSHVKFASDQTVLKVSLRLDAQTTWPSTFTPKNGSTLSWAVALAAR